MPGYWNAHSDLDWSSPLDDPRDDYEPDGPYPEEECGRWRNGKLAPLSECLSAGTEFCQVECPMRNDTAGQPGTHQGRR